MERQADEGGAQARPGATNGTAADDAGEATHEAAADEGLGEQFRQLREDLGAFASEKAEAAREQARAAIEERKAAAAAGLSEAADALRQAARRLDPEQPLAADLTTRGAAALAQVADRLRERDIEVLIGDLRAFAQRQPELFFIGALALGFVATRFVKSSRPAATAPDAGIDPPAMTGATAAGAGGSA